MFWWMQSDCFEMGRICNKIREQSKVLGQYVALETKQCIIKTLVFLIVHYGAQICVSVEVIKASQWLSHIVFSRRLFYYIFRRDKETTEMFIVQNKWESIRPRRKSARWWTDQIREVTYSSICLSILSAKNSVRWR